MITFSIHLYKSEDKAAHGQPASACFDEALLSVGLCTGGYLAVTAGLDLKTAREFVGKCQLVLAEMESRCTDDTSTVRSGR